MDTFKHDGKEIEFSVTTGEVIEYNSHVETSVSSSGGGGFIKDGTGFVNAPSIHSTNVMCHDVWLRTEDGKEKSIKFRGQDFPVRVSNSFTMIAARKAGSESWVMSVAMNNTVGRRYFLATAQELVNAFGFGKKTGKIVLYTLGVFLLMGYVMAQLGANGSRETPILNTIWFIAPIAFFVHKMIQQSVRVKSIVNSLKEHLEVETQYIFEENQEREQEPEQNVA